MRSIGRLVLKLNLSCKLLLCVCFFPPDKFIILLGGGRGLKGLTDIRGGGQISQTTLGIVSDDCILCSL